MAASEAPSLSHRGLAVVGVRLLALYLGAGALQRLAAAWLVTTDTGAGRDWLIANAALTALFAAVLWLATGPLVSAMVPARRALSDEAVEPVNQRGLARLAFAVFGLFLCLDALPELLVKGWLNRHDLDLIPPLAGPALQAAFGVMVFCSAHGLGRLASQLRYAGRGA